VFGILGGLNASCGTEATSSGNQCGVAGLSAQPSGSGLSCRSHTVPIGAALPAHC
jgi:hypothetical protein